MAEKKPNKTYINHQTGEIFNAVDISLARLCEGYTDRRFQSDLKFLVSRMMPGEKGSLTVKVKVEMLVNERNERVVELTVDNSMNLPKSSMKDAIQKNIDSQGYVLEIIDDMALFPKEPME